MVRPRLDAGELMYGAGYLDVYRNIYHIEYTEVNEYINMNESRMIDINSGIHQSQATLGSNVYAPRIEENPYPGWNLLEGG